MAAKFCVWGLTFILRAPVDWRSLKLLTFSRGGEKIASKILINLGCRLLSGAHPWADENDKNVAFNGHIEIPCWRSFLTKSKLQPSLTALTNWVIYLFDLFRLINSTKMTWKYSKNTSTLFKFNPSFLSYLLPISNLAISRHSLQLVGMTGELLSS